MVRPLITDRLIDHVPGIDLTLAVLHDGRDVVLHDAQSLVAGPPAPAQPPGQRLLPDQGVAAQLHPVGLRKCAQSVHLPEVEPVASRTKGLHLEGVLGDAQVELAAERLPVFGLIQQRHRHGGANAEAALFGQLAQGWSSGRLPSPCVYPQPQGDEENALQECSVTALDQHASLPYFRLRATPAWLAARWTAAATRWTTWRLKTLGTMYSALSSRGVMHWAMARAAACFMLSVICVARTSRAPRKMPGNASTLLIWLA